MSLEIIKVNGKRALCKCTVCGVASNDIVNMVYNISDIESGKAVCRACNFLSKTGTSNTEVWKKLILDEANNKRYSIGEVCSISTKDSSDMSLFKDFPLGSRVGDGVIAGAVTKFKGINSMGYPTYYMSGYYLAVKCRYCNCVTFSNNPKDFACPVCSIQRNLVTQKAQQKMQEKSADKEFISFDIVKPPKEGGKMDRNLKRLEELNPKYKVINYSVKDGLQYNMVCQTCGSVQTVNRANTRIKECEICDTQKRNQLGVLKRDYIGVTKLGLTCKAQDKDNFTCTLICSKCNREHDNIPLYYFLLGRYCCDCKASNEIFSDLTCPNCYKPLSEYKMVDVLRNDSNLVCSCGENLNSFIEEEMFTYNARVSLRTKINMANDALKKSGTAKIKFTNQNQEVNPELVTEEISLYRGNKDGKLYKRCYCQKHNIALILNEDEILGYDHEKCKDSRQGVVANISFPNLKLE